MSWKTKEGGRDWEWGWYRDSERGRVRDRYRDGHRGREKERQRQGQKQRQTTEAEEEMEPGAKADTASEAKARGRQLSSSASPLNAALPTSFSLLPCPLPRFNWNSTDSCRQPQNASQTGGKITQKKKTARRQKQNEPCIRFYEWKLRDREGERSIESMATLLTKLLAFSFGALNAVAKWRKVR